MSRFVCVHGHFYQPPRENPWLEAIERQDSAHPDHDWNERIAGECYLPNGRSRVLDDEEHLVALCNNYAKISFNFGPTLLSWMERFAPEAYASVLEGDRLSIERFGHGSAMAQAYNHAIMPLANGRDKRTQIAWGIRDFEHRFKRRPEGMWLPEAAVDTPTLEALAEQEIAFTLLAPRQAARTRAIGDEHWDEGEHFEVNPRRPYLCRLPSGRSITLFFYDGPVSQAVAFEQLLHSGAGFAERILTAFDDEDSSRQLAHIATDGESYGHHHRFGDMALAAALNVIEHTEGVELTNYASYLAAHPPEHEVEVDEPSSWSCAHGVERWRADCGCNAGIVPGASQAWRAPLREALDGLRDELAPRFESVAGELLRDPWAARDDYIGVVLDRTGTTGAFFERHAVRELTADECSTALELLEMQRHAMLMYTSCGWFFDDVAGIETVQIIQYAGRAIQIARDTLGFDAEYAFIERLADAQSNKPKVGTGRDVYAVHVEPAVVQLADIAAHAAIASLFERRKTRTGTVFCYDAPVHIELDLHAGRTRFRTGRVDVRSRITERSGAFDFAVVHLGDHVVCGGVLPAGELANTEGFAREASDAFDRADFLSLLGIIERTFGGTTYSLGSLLADAQRDITARLLEGTVDRVRRIYREIFDRHAPLLRFHASLRAPPPRELAAAAELVLGSELIRALETAPEGTARAGELLDDAEVDDVALDEATVAHTAERALDRLLQAWHASPESSTPVADLAELVEFVQRLSFRVDVEPVQIAVYRIGHAIRPHADAAWREAFDRLAASVRVRLPE